MLHSSSTLVENRPPFERRQQFQILQIHLLTRSAGSMHENVVVPRAAHISKILKCLLRQKSNFNRFVESGDFINKKLNFNRASMRRSRGFTSHIKHWHFRYHHRESPAQNVRDERLRRHVPKMRQYYMRIFG